MTAPSQEKIAACKARLDQAVKAAEDLESHVRWLVKERAWEVLGYVNLSELWEAHAGYKCPKHVQCIATVAMAEEGMDTRKGAHRYLSPPNGHRTADIASAIGLEVVPVTKDGAVTGYGGPQVSAILRQHAAGVPPEHIVYSDKPHFQNRAIDKYGDPNKVVRHRQQPRRAGKFDDELVAEGFGCPKSWIREIEEIARAADVPKAEIYRTAVAEFLARYRESRPGVAS